MAYTISKKSIPKVGEVVKSVDIDNKNRVADIEFESGKKVVVHVWDKEDKKKESNL